MHKLTRYKINYVMFLNNELQENINFDERKNINYKKSLILYNILERFLTFSLTEHPTRYNDGVNSWSPRVKLKFTSNKEVE